ncbi:inositol polyphosphate-5-phosphatase A-like, partial [Garra rufa]|uniref:inositol polyphosphate-5-phosphatase A-like n=1 Tax=Garra rufa TaxID=137080 RepID=UPI003CCEEA5C
QAHRPHFVALHCQEVGGKNYEASMAHVDSFIKELLSSDAMKDFNRACVYLDKNYKSQEQFTALGCCYFIHESLKNIQQFDFKAKKFRKVVGKEVHSDTLPSTATLEKEKFPKDYFPELIPSIFLSFGFWSVFINEPQCVKHVDDITRIPRLIDSWRFHQQPIRKEAALIDEGQPMRFTRSVTLLTRDRGRTGRRTPEMRLCASSPRLDPALTRRSSAFITVVLQLEKKLFTYINQDVFRENNGRLLLEFDKELSVFKERLHELDISFPPSYPYSEDSSQGKQYMNTRCPAWCDRILMSASAKDLLIKPENEEKSITYDTIGPNVCMGDHKPVYLYFRLTPGPGKPNANKHKCCVVQ